MTYEVVWSGRGALPGQRDDDPAWAMPGGSPLLQAAPGRENFITTREALAVRAPRIISHWAQPKTRPGRRLEPGPRETCRTCPAELSPREVRIGYRRCPLCRARGAQVSVAAPP